MLVLLAALDQILYQMVDLIGSIGVGIVPSALYPLEGDTCLFVPRLVVSDAGTGMVLLSADQQGGAGNLIGKIGLHGIGQHPKPVPCEGRIAFLVAVVDHHHGAHETSSIGRSSHALCAGFQEPLSRIVLVHGLHSF